MRAAKVREPDPRRPLRPEVLAKLQLEMQRLASSNQPRVREFVEKMAARYPEVIS